MSQGDVAEECGGVGDVRGVPFVWVTTEEALGGVEAMFESGHCLKFPNSAQGWTDFWVWALVCSGAMGFGPNAPPPVAP